MEHLGLTYLLESIIYLTNLNLHITFFCQNVEGLTNLHIPMCFRGVKCRNHDFFVFGCLKHQQNGYRGDLAQGKHHPHENQCTYATAVHLDGPERGTKQLLKIKRLDGATIQGTS